MQINIKNSHFLLTAASAYSNYLSLLRCSTYQRLRSPTKKPRSIVCVIPSRMHGPRAVSLGSWFPPNFLNGSFGSRFFGRIRMSGHEFSREIQTGGTRYPAWPVRGRQPPGRNQACSRTASALIKTLMRAAMRDHGDVSAEPRPRSRGHIPRWCGRKRTSPSAPCSEWPCATTLPDPATAYPPPAGYPSRSRNRRQP